MWMISSPGVPDTEGWGWGGSDAVLLHWVAASQQDTSVGQTFSHGVLSKITGLRKRILLVAFFFFLSKNFKLAMWKTFHWNLYLFCKNESRFLSCQGKKYILLWYVLMEYLRITFPNGQDNFISVAVLHLVKAIFFREGKQKINFEEI